MSDEKSSGWGASAAIAGLLSLAASVALYLGVWLVLLLVIVPIFFVISKIIWSCVGRGEDAHWTNLRFWSSIGTLISLTLVTAFMVFAVYGLYWESYREVSEKREYARAEAEYHAYNEREYQKRLAKEKAEKQKHQKNPFLHVLTDDEAPQEGESGMISYEEVKKDYPDTPPPQ